MLQYFHCAGEVENTSLFLSEMKRQAHDWTIFHFDHSENIMYKKKFPTLKIVSENNRMLFYQPYS